MWWCRSVSNTRSGESTEVEVKSTFAATEVWLDLCHDTETRHEKLRAQNAQRLAELSKDKRKLFDDRTRARQEIGRIQAKIDTIDSLLRELESAEEEIRNSEKVMQEESEYIRSKNGSLKERLNDISELVAVPVPGSRNAPLRLSSYSKSGFDRRNSPKSTPTPDTRASPTIQTPSGDGYRPTLAITS